MSVYHLQQAETIDPVKALPHIHEKLVDHDYKAVYVGQGNNLIVVCGPSFVHSAMRAMACQLTTLKTVFEVVVVLSNKISPVTDTKLATMLLQVPDPRGPGHDMGNVNFMLSTLCSDTKYINPDWRSTLFDLCSVPSDQRMNTLDVVRQQNVIVISLKNEEVDDVYFNMSALLRHMCCYCLTSTLKCMCVKGRDAPLTNVYIHSMEVTATSITIELRQMHLMMPSHNEATKRPLEDEH